MSTENFFERTSLFDGALLFILTIFEYFIIGSFPVYSTLEILKYDIMNSEIRFLALQSF
jgi:hypothetical protein